jgi:hypothetical protein
MKARQGLLKKEKRNGAKPMKKSNKYIYFSIE